MSYRETSTTRDLTATLIASAEAGDWRARLRLSFYGLYRDLGERSIRPIEEEVERLSSLIDEGRAEPTSPSNLTRLTAEALGGAIFRQLWIASREQAPPASELVPMLMYMAVLPYAGADRAAEELRVPPPPR